MRNRLEDLGRLYAAIDQVIKSPLFSYSDDDDDFTERYNNHLNDVKDEVIDIKRALKGCWLICRAEDELNRLEHERIDRWDEV